MAEDVGTLVARVVADTEQFRSEMLKMTRQLETNTAKMNTSLARVNQGMGAVGNAARAAARFLGVFGVALSVSSLVSFARRSVDAADAIGEMAKAAGLGAERFQRLQFVFGQNGVEAGNFQSAMNNLNVALGQFVTTGGGRAKKAIEELGLAQRITSGEIKTSEQFFDAIVVQFKNIDSAAVRAGLAAQLFGREAGAKMAETLSMGTEALAEMEAGVDGVISDENIKRADELDKAFRSMAQTVGSTLKNAFVSATYAVFDFFGAFKTEAEAADDLVKSIKQQLEAREFLSPARIAELQARLDEALEAQRQAGRNVRAQSSTRQGVRDRMAGGTGEVAPGLPDEISIAAQPFMPVAHTEFPGMGLEESLRATRASGSMDPFMLTPEMREQAMEEAAEQRAEMAAAIVKDHANLAQQVVDEERRLAAERIEVEQSVQDAKMAAAYSAIGFLQVLGREHRGAARAALAIEKALAIKQIIFNTRVAAAKALAQFGPLGKPAAIAILAWGAAQAAFVASQGWSEASQIPSSGSGSIPGTGSNPLITSPASSAAAGALSSQRQSAVQVIIQGDMYGWDEYIQRRVIDGIRRAVDGRDVVIIGPNSRNAEILRDAA